MLKLFESISGLVKRDADPLADARAANQWIKDISHEDLGGRLAAVRTQLVTLVGRPAYRLENLQALFVIDEKIQLTYLQVCQQYVQNPRAGKAIEEKLWNDIIGFSRDMLAAYQPFVVNEDLAPEEANGFRQVTALMLARALHYVGIQVKWHFFRFQTPPSQLWSATNHLFRLAEISGVDSDPFPLYPSQDANPTSCADEFIRIQMLATLNNGNFSLRQFDWADRWLTNWSRHVQVERKCREHVHQFCVDLAEPTGPAKIHGFIEGEMLRFWGVGELLAEMGRTMHQLEGGDSPARLGLGDDARMPACLDFMRQLEILWSRERNQQLSRDERTQVSKLVQVVSGLDHIFSAIRFDDERAMARASARSTPDSDEVMDMKLYGYITERTKQKVAAMQSRHYAYGSKVKEIEHGEWVVENQSTGGFGAVLPLNGHDWVRLGVLLAVRNDANSNWMLAVTRRLNRIDAEHLYAGVQILTPTPVAASLKSMDGERQSTMSIDGGVDTLGLTAPKSALYVPYIGDGKRVNSLLIHASDYAPGKVYQVVARDKVFMVRISETLEKGPDWVWAAVEVLRRDV
ncbi:hypothetical protein [Chitinimonas sp. BJB300]|uniref:hypothetical protein n=1 Tax=Chitinimonas sp. BJB300 TaxID=1559339 RepID=UPI000C10B22E|nr:hypothetical protein [Chitinimonas sp. BJB300]PHV11568.1 hypothetical protein CSQ89_10220 [Chitinimonas sp. BJB300]TSJ88974.1 hypothetical protein FG002_008800 [Chitinimonas sp. BJB300]